VKTVSLLEAPTGGEIAEMVAALWRDINAANDEANRRILEMNGYARAPWYEDHVRAARDIAAMKTSPLYDQIERLSAAALVLPPEPFFIPEKPKP